MTWISVSCPNCNGLNCMRPINYSKPLICVHPSINNLTDYLQKEPTATPNCTSATSLFFLLIIITVMLTIILLDHLWSKLSRVWDDYKLRKELVKRRNKKRSHCRQSQLHPSQPLPLHIPPLITGVNRQEQMEVPQISVAVVTEEPKVEQQGGEDEQELDLR
ncbi:hypothetical protein niasHT_005695 [Heterodera trifolii]|uniref:Transmembrane protein n=1 Tax=Heterodera trifolii TaxID=157864 RepID=A0ABD2L8R1_9BILA